MTRSAYQVDYDEKDLPIRVWFEVSSGKRAGLWRIEYVGTTSRFLPDAAKAKIDMRGPYWLITRSEKANGHDGWLPTDELWSVPASEMMDHEAFTLALAGLVGARKAKAAIRRLTATRS